MIAEGIRDLIIGEKPDTSAAGIVLTGLSIVVMPWLARVKRRAGHEMNYRLAVADAAETKLCAWLSVSTFAGAGRLRHLGLDLTRPGRRIRHRRLCDRGRQRGMGGRTGLRGRLIHRPGPWPYAPRSTTPSPTGRAERAGRLHAVTPPAFTDMDRTRRLLRRGFALEYATLGWNVTGVVVLAVAATAARSVALAGFGLDSLIEIGASAVVVWELSGTGQARRRRALRLIACAFLALALYLLVQSSWVLGVGHRAGHSLAGIVWTALTAAVMFALAAGKSRTGRALGNPVLSTEGRVTLIDGILAAAVLAGLIGNAAAGWWWADPLAGYVLVYYAIREARAILTGDH